MARVSKVMREIMEKEEEVLPVTEKEQEVAETAPTKKDDGPKEAEINKFEKHDGEPPSEDWSGRSMGMNYSNKIQSMKNAVKILPPNMVINGRHRKENIQAICGFMVSDEMMDEVYKDFVHPEYR